MAILPYQMLRGLIFGKIPQILSKGDKIQDSQIQPASLDCRLGDKVYRMGTSMIPRPEEKVASLIEKYAIAEFELREGTLLGPNACYIVPLQETLDLSKEFFGVFSPKSSTGRTDTFVRALCDGAPFYDKVPKGYQGSLYLEIIPLSFKIGIAPGLELAQLRIKSANRFFSNEELRVAHCEYGIIYDKDGKIINDPDIEDGGLYFHADLNRDIIGFQAKTNTIKNWTCSRNTIMSTPTFWNR